MASSSGYVKLHNSGFYELRRSPGVVGDLESRGTRYERACGEGFEMSSQQGAKRPQGRHRVTVITATRKAKRKNAKYNTLLRNLDAAR